MIPVYAENMEDTKVIIEDDCSDLDVFGYVNGTGISPENVSISQQNNNLGGDNAAKAFDITQQYDENGDDYIKVNTKDCSIENVMMGLKHPIPGYDNSYFTINLMRSLMTCRWLSGIKDGEVSPWR